MTTVTFLTFYSMFTRLSKRHGDVNNSFYDVDGARGGQFVFMRGPIWVRVDRLLWV